MSFFSLSYVFIFLSAVPCLPYHARPCLALPRQAVPRLPCRARPCQAKPRPASPAAPAFYASTSPTLFASSNTRAHSDSTSYFLLKRAKSLNDWSSSCARSASSERQSMVVRYPSFPRSSTRLAYTRTGVLPPSTTFTSLGASISRPRPRARPAQLGEGQEHAGKGTC